MCARLVECKRGLSNEKRGASERLVAREALGNGMQEGSHW